MIATTFHIYIYLTFLYKHLRKSLNHLSDVDKIFKSDKVMSQLSLAIFIAPRTHLDPQNHYIPSYNRQNAQNSGIV